MTNTTDPQFVVLAGDTHGNPHALQQIFSEARNHGAIAIIQCGDYGFGWSVGEDGIDDFAYLTNEFCEETGIPFYWLDGNHENFDKLYELPIDPETGLRPVLGRVTHLPRGSSLTIGNTTFRAFGGAHSVDKHYRVKGKSWWAQEMVTEEDVEVAINAGQADVFLSHDAPMGVQNVRNLEKKLSSWGAEATEKSLINQERVRRALDASGAKRAFHGHLHQRYEFELDTGVLVMGLNRDEEANNTYLLEV